MKRIISILIVLTMIFSLSGISAIASSTDDTGNAAAIAKIKAGQTYTQMDARSSITEVADGVWHYTMWHNIVSTYIIVGKTGTMVWDTCMAEFTAPVATDKAATQFKDNENAKYFRTIKEEIERCITATLGTIPANYTMWYGNSHNHGDHVAYNAYFNSLGWKFIAPSYSINSLFMGSDSLRFLEVAKKTGRIVNTGDKLDLGGRTLTYIAAPMAHGTDSLWFIDDASRILFTGDEIDGGQIVGTDRLVKQTNGKTKAQCAHENAKFVLDKYYKEFDFLSGQHNSMLLDKSYLFDVFMLTGFLADSDPSSPTYETSFNQLLTHMAPADDATGVTNKDNTYRFRYGMAQYTLGPSAFTEAENALLKLYEPAWLYDYQKGNIGSTNTTPLPLSNVYQPTDAEVAEYGKVGQGNTIFTMPSETTFTYFKLSPTVYEVAYGKFFSMFIIKGEQYAIVIDTMNTMATEELSAGYKDNYIRKCVERFTGDLPLKVVISSAEQSHIGNLEQFADCEFYTTRKTADVLRSYGLKYKINVVKDGDKIKYGSAAPAAFAVPGAIPAATTTVNTDKYVTFKDLNDGYLGVLDNYTKSFFAGNRICPIQVNLLGKTKAQIQDFVKAMDIISAMKAAKEYKYLIAGDNGSGYVSSNYIETLKTLAQAILSGDTSKYKAHISDGANMQPAWVFSDYSKRIISTNNKRVSLKNASIIYSMDSLQK